MRSHRLWFVSLVVVFGLGLGGSADADGIDNDVGRDSDYLLGLMRAQPERMAIALDPAQAKAHRVQVLVSFVQNDGDDGPRLERHGFRVDAEYFYPASAIKLGAAVAALELVQSLAAAGHRVKVDTPLIYHPLFDGEELDTDDSSNLRGGRITVRHLIRQTIIVSSNHAFNRLYELVGHQALNRSMRAAGLEHSYFLHRLSRWLSPEENLRTPRVDFDTRAGTVTVPERTSELEIRHFGIPGLEVGASYIDSATDREIAAPMSFARKNRMTLVDLQDLLVMVTRPDIKLGRPGFQLTRRHRRLLMRALREYPSESKNPVFEGDEYRAERFKHLLPGLLRVVPEDELTIFSKAGKAYGFTIENAYVVPARGRRGFFLTTVIYTNPNQRLNDNDYTYDEVGDPFIHDLTELIARALWDIPAPAPAP
ncbi:MAG: hypothetical protein Tsb0020_11570 [Haliangiales bacterium]